MASAQLLFFILVIIPSAILHEYAHGLMAERLGDPTPRLAGRLTMNPAAHIDLWGTIILPFSLFFLTNGSFLFAYAKPMPYNPLALRAQRWGSALVGAAGPAANLLVAFVLGAVVRLAPDTLFAAYLTIIVYANVLLAVFNLVPIPPLDGSKVLFTFLPTHWYAAKVWLERYGIMLLLIFLFTLSRWLVPIIWSIVNLAVGGGI